MTIDSPVASLDPEDWEAFRSEAHAMLDAALDRLQGAGEGRVWTPLPDAEKAAYQAPLPREGMGSEAVQDRMNALLPYGVGNTHPRYFGWVHGAGTPSNMIADITAAAINANLRLRIVVLPEIWLTGCYAMLRPGELIPSL